MAVPPGALRFGAGARQFSMVVEQILDLVDRQEIVGRVGEAYVHVELPAGLAPPAAGARVLVHADRSYDLI